MAVGPKLSSSDVRSLPVLDVHIPPMPNSGGAAQRRTHVFNVGQSPAKYTVEDLKKTSARNSDRTDFFEKTLLGIWLSTGKQAVPYAFKTADDDTIRSLDAGCLGYLMNRVPPRLEVSEFDEFGHIKSVMPTAALRSQHRGLSDENLRKRIEVPKVERTTEEATAQLAEFDAPAPQDAETEVPLGFDPFGDFDERTRVISLQVRREGQREFTKAMRANWGEHCPVTKTTVKTVLDGAHIYPYGGTATNDHRNGLLLRADIHRLFDLHLVSFSYDGPDLVFHVSDSLKVGEYGRYDELRIAGNALPKSAPHRDVIRRHHLTFLSRKSS